MPRVRMSMRKIREVLRLRQDQKLSFREVAAACQIGTTSVHQYLRRAGEAGVTWPLPEELTDEALEELLFPTVFVPRDERVLPDLEWAAREMRRKGVTLYLLWEEYRKGCDKAYGYSRFCELYNAHVGQLDPRMRQVHRAGEKLFVDYAGHTLGVMDPATGAVRQAQIFVATLGASDYSFAEATWTQSLEDWIGSHVRAFLFLGGVPAILVPDNLKSGVTTPCLYEPKINPSYQEMAEHYGVAIIPARPAKPRDKALVENHVLNVERRVLAPLRDRTFFNLDEANLVIAALMKELNARPFQQLKGSRAQLFQEVDQPALRALPVGEYEFGYWKKGRVTLDYHVCVDHCFYSVPYTLIREEVEIRLSARVIEIFHDHQRVASHARSTRPNQHVTLAGHMPLAHQAHQEWTPERIAHWALKIGPATSRVVQEVMDRRTHPQQGFRSCIGIISLAKGVGSLRCEAACVRALAIGSPSYQSIKSILHHRLDEAQLPAIQLTLPCPEHPNIRGAEYYGKPH